MCRAALALWLSACAGPTQIIVVCDTDLEPGTEVAAIEVSVSSEDAFPDSHRFELDTVELPFSFGVTPSRHHDEEVRITARAVAPDGTGVTRFEAETRFIPGQSRVLEIPLSRACTGELLCENDLTCLRGECVSPAVDPEGLPAFGGYTLAPLFDGPSVAPDAGAPDAGPPCVEGASCETGNPCEIGAQSCGAEAACEGVETRAVGSDCGGGRICSLEGRCGS